MDDMKMVRQAGESWSSMTAWIKEGGRKKQEGKKKERKKEREKERKKEREKERKKERKRERKREGKDVCGKPGISSC